MERRKGELSLVSKYIKERIREMEIDMEVRKVKTPEYIQNDSFEKKMRRRLRTPRLRKKIRMSSSYTEPEETSDEQPSSSSPTESDLPSISLEDSPVEEPCTEHRKEKPEKPEKQAKKKGATGTKERMKCGCTNHSTQKTEQTASTGNRRKSIN